MFLKYRWLKACVVVALGICCMNAQNRRDDADEARKSQIDNAYLRVGVFRQHMSEVREVTERMASCGQTQGSRSEKFDQCLALFFRVRERLIEELEHARFIRETLTSLPSNSDGVIRDYLAQLDSITTTWSGFLAQSKQSEKALTDIGIKALPRELTVEGNAVRKQVHELFLCSSGPKTLAAQAVLQKAKARQAVAEQNPFLIRAAYRMTKPLRAQAQMVASVCKQEGALSRVYSEIRIIEEINENFKYDEIIKSRCNELPPVKRRGLREACGKLSRSDAFLYTLVTLGGAR